MGLPSGLQSRRREKTNLAAGGRRADGAMPATESVVFKSPAEFFAENQNIAGFDNVRGAAATRARALMRTRRRPRLARRCTQRSASSWRTV